MREFWKIWKYALGSFNDETTKKYDNWICIIRTLVMNLLLPIVLLLPVIFVTGMT